MLPKTDLLRSHPSDPPKTDLRTSTGMSPLGVVTSVEGCAGELRETACETHEILAVLHTDPTCHGDDSLDQRSVMLGSNC